MKRVVIMRALKNLLCVILTPPRRGKNLIKYGWRPFAESILSKILRSLRSLITTGSEGFRVRLLSVRVNSLILAVMLLSFGPAFGDEKSATDKDKSETPMEMLQKSVATWYDIETQDVTRYACFVQCKEIFKAQELRTTLILEQVKYELIWEPDKAVKVKPRDIPGFFGPVAKHETRLYAQEMEKTYRKLFKIIQPVKQLSKLIAALDKTGRFEITLTKDKSLSKIELTPKNPDKPKRLPRRRKGKEEEYEDKKGPIIIWLNKGYQITKFEFTNKNEKVTASIKPIKYGKLWNIRRLDITKVDATKDKFKERVIIDFAYTYPRKIMLPSRIKITNLNKEGKVLKRRNEPNPITITLSKYEVEVNK